MNKKLKRIMTLVTMMMFIFTTMLATGTTAFAEDYEDVWYVGKPDGINNVGWHGSGGKFSVDTKNYYKDSRYSIKLDNGNEYRHTRVQRTIDLEPNTTYKLSAMVKCSGFEISPDAKNKETGVFLSVFRMYDGHYYPKNASKKITKGGWTKLECTFTTTRHADEQYIFHLFNGENGSDCKGTAWFSDIKLEKQEKTNQWNVLVAVFRNIDLDLDLTGKNVRVEAAPNGLTHYEASFSDEAMKNIKKSANELYDVVGTLSGGLAEVVDIDFLIIDEPLTKLQDDGAGYCIGFVEECVPQKILDAKLAQKTYQQILMYAPISELSGGTAGWGGYLYNGVQCCQFKARPDIGLPIRAYAEDFYSETIIHEIIHGLEDSSEDIDPTNVDDVHNAEDYGYIYNSKEWFSDFMQNKVYSQKDKAYKGILPGAYLRYSGEWTLFDNDMSVGGKIDTSALPLNISKATFYKVKDQSYTGKAVKPDVKIKDGNYTLKKGVDYTLSYKNNKKAGTATVTIKGKGIYTGTRTLKFKIVKKPLSTKAPTVKASIVDGKIKVSWSKVEGAEKYTIWVSKNNKDFTKLKELKSTSSGFTMKYNSKTEYQFAVSAYIPQLEKSTEDG